MAVANTIQNNTNIQLDAIFTLGISLAASSVVVANISQSLTDTVGTSSVTVPPNQVWHFVDAYVSASLTYDMKIDIVVANTAQNLNFDANSTLITAGNSRLNPFAGMQGLTIPANATFQIKGFTLAANGTIATTEHVYFNVVPMPFGNLGIPNTKQIRG